MDVIENKTSGYCQDSYVVNGILFKQFSDKSEFLKTVHFQFVGFLLEFKKKCKTRFQKLQTQ